MNRKFVNDMMLLLSSGWRPYSLKPDVTVYERVGCPFINIKRKDPVWFVREDVFLCVSCNKSCTLTRPEGFIVPLPMAVQNMDKKDPLPFKLTPGEMVSHKALLRVDEAAYCLNISARQVYSWIAEGKLRRVKDAPVRVSAEDVALLMSDFEE